MFFSKSLTFNEEDMKSVALATGLNSAGLQAEKDFIEKLIAGDAEAFDHLVVRHISDIYALLVRITGDVEEAGDLTQETFLSVFKAVKKFRGDADLKTWLFRIAINKSHNRHRWWKRRKRGQTISLDASYGDSDSALSETIASDLANPEENILRLERERTLLAALRQLPDIFREAVVLCDLEGFSYEEIAAILEINIGTVKSRIARGREDLRRKLIDV